MVGEEIVVKSGVRSTRLRQARVLGAALVALLGIASQAAAQTVPPTVDPGRIPERFEPPRRPGVDTRVVVPQIPTAVPPEQARQIRFVLHGIVVDGATAYTAQQLSVHYQNLVGREVSLLEVYGVATQITGRYRNDGYILSQALVPQQQIREGIVRIQVLEGRINRVIIRDEGKLASHNYILQYATRLTASRPVTQREF